MSSRYHCFEVEFPPILKAQSEEMPVCSELSCWRELQDSSYSRWGPVIWTVLEGPLVKSSLNASVRLLSFIFSDYWEDLMRQQTLGFAYKLLNIQYIQFPIEGVQSKTSSVISHGTESSVCLCVSVWTCYMPLVLVGVCEASHRIFWE